jgi:hypothetical protein
MHKIYAFIFIATVWYGCGVTPVDSHKAAPKLTGNIQQDVNNLLPEGGVTVNIMDGVKKDPRLSELNKKYKKGTRENYGWYVQYIKNYKIGEPIPYHENFGLTPDEYKEMQERIDKISFFSTGLQEIRVIKQNGIISFKTEKRLKEFENVSFNLNNNTAKLGDYTLEFVDTVSMNTTKNGFKSKWKGYLWTYENPKDIHMEALENVVGLNVVQYKITLAQLEDGRTLFSINATEVQEGIIVLKFDVPLLI